MCDIIRYLELGAANVLGRRTCRRPSLSWAHSHTSWPLHWVQAPSPACSCPSSTRPRSEVCSVCLLLFFSTGSDAGCCPGQKSVLGYSFIWKAASRRAGSMATTIHTCLSLSFVPNRLIPTRTGRAVAAAMTSHWVCNVVVGQTFIAAVSNYGLASVYTFFGSVALLGALYVSTKVGLAFCLCLVSLCNFLEPEDTVRIAGALLCCSALPCVAGCSVCSCALSERSKSMHPCSRLPQ